LECDIQALVSLKATANWDGVKERRIQKVRNGMLDVSKHAHWVRLRLLVSNKLAWTDTLAALKATTPEDVQVACQSILSNSHLEALVEGNLSAAAAAAMCRCDSLV
jgi:secreted Zn-dependent insulinase-like peptidase